MHEDRKLYIGGRFVESTSKATFETVNPATGAVLARVETANAGDVDRAVVSARAGQRVWSRMTGTQRGRVLRRAADLLRARIEPLAALEVADTGKPIAEARSVDIPSAADAIEHFAGLAAAIAGDHIDLVNAFVYTRREPLGVCAGIGAWNYPLQIAAWKSAPALAAGNAMVFKPSELTPLSALELARIYTESGVPDGVFNVVQGAAETGRALTAHPGVAKVSLTGEVSTGRAVMGDAARTLKHVTMELGGKSPLIIFGDAALDQAVTAAMLANFFTQGEVCSNGTRVFVDAAIYDHFLERLVPRVKKMRVGDPMDPQTEVGALISGEHLERVARYVDLGKREGARLLAGGDRPKLAPPCENGWFLTPAVFADCNDDQTIVREEIFGPVMSVLRFDSEDEVIRRANASEYGLAAGVFTRDLSRAHRVVAELEAGTCWINNYNVTPIEMPFGGVKQSGLGRENGLAVLEHYTQLKSVYVELGEIQNPWSA